MHKPGPMKGTLPHYLKEELAERQEARERDSKFLGRKRQRATPSLQNREGPRSLEEEKLSTRVFPGASLPRDGAALCLRRAISRRRFRDYSSKVA